MTTKSYPRRRRKKRHCRTCRCFTCWPKSRKPLRKYSVKKPIATYENGIKTFPDGHQRCKTKQAWENRREECFKRDDYTCQQRMLAFRPLEASKSDFGGWPICGLKLEPNEAHPHHIRKRSVGRDDRLANLVTLCGVHHKLHDSQPQWGRK